MGDAAVTEQREVKIETLEKEEEKVATSKPKAKKKVQFKGKIISKNYDSIPTEENVNVENNVFVVFVECETPGNI